jgi:DNA mismatch repair ATPase MutL
VSDDRIAGATAYAPVETEFAKLVAESGWASLPSPNSNPAQGHIPLTSARADASPMQTLNPKPFYQHSLHGLTGHGLTGHGLTGQVVTDLQLKKEEAINLPLDWKLIGYLHHTYFLIETSTGLSVIEQHIAHERVLYERILSEKRQSKHQSEHLQKLIISCALDLSSEQASFLSVQQEKLAEMGFEFEEKDGVFHCTQVPVELANKDYSKAVQEILQSLLDSASPTIHLEIAKSLACQSAIKNGMPLSEAQIFELLTDWYNTPRNETCPHGRPIKLDFSKNKLFQMFHPV